MSNSAKNVDLLATGLSILHNYLKILIILMNY